MDIFSDFPQKGIINKVMNDTYIALIAKKDKCCFAGDYRSISLTTAMYKLLAKTLADRLKETLPTLFRIPNGFCERETNYGCNSCSK